MRRLGVIFGEGDGHDWVIEDVTRCDICIQIINERCTIRRAVAGNFDGLTIGSLYSAITITVPVGLTPDEKPN